MKANEATAKLSTISYKAGLHGEGGFASQLPRLSGKVLARKDPTKGSGQVRIEALASAAAASPTSPPSAPEAQIIVSNGSDAFFLDESRRSFTTGKPQEAQAAVPAYALYSPKMLSDAPFAEELRAASITHEGTQTIEGDECDVVVVKYDSAGSRSDKLYIAKKDSLLRRIEKAIQFRFGAQPEVVRGLLVFSANSLDTQPSVDDKAFTLDCPQGYRKETFRPSAAPAGAGQSGDAPDWEMTTAEGKSVTLRSLRGKVVVMDFWATWCGPCKMAMPLIQKLHDRFQGKPVVVYGVNCWERSPNPMAYVKSKNYTYPQLLNGDRAATAYGLTGIPTLIIIGPDGKIIFRTSGYHPAVEEQMATVIENALKKQPQG
jgi:thiol-disulfide isomerase/thioredoxin